MKVMEKKINIVLPEKLQETIHDLQANDSDQAKGYVELVDQIMMYFLKENVQSVIDVNEHDMLKLLADILSLKIVLQKFIL